MKCYFCDENTYTKTLVDWKKERVVCCSFCFRLYVQGNDALLYEQIEKKEKSK